MNFYKKIFVGHLYIIMLSLAMIDFFFWLKFIGYLCIS